MSDYQEGIDRIRAEQAAAARRAQDGETAAKQAQQARQQLLFRETSAALEFIRGKGIPPNRAAVKGSQKLFGNGGRLHWDLDFAGGRLGPFLLGPDGVLYDGSYSKWNRQYELNAWAKRHRYGEGAIDSYHPTVVGQRYDFRRSEGSGVELARVDGEVIYYWQDEWHSPLPIHEAVLGFMVAANY